MKPNVIIIIIIEDCSTRKYHIQTKIKFHFLEVIEIIKFLEFIYFLFEYK